MLHGGIYHLVRIVTLGPYCAGVGFHHVGIINCAGIVTLFVLASLSSLYWCCCPCCASAVALVALVWLLSVAWSTALSAAWYMTAQLGQRHLKIDCKMQSQQGQRGLHDKGTNASAPRMTMSA
jgi:hypothetical protein